VSDMIVIINISDVIIVIIIIIN